ncbi:MAG TPA: sulfurtransferase [Gammaproteobacteria bacterium]|jgi:thiosulfate/3-mercaptopyruvate sulfurtransferase|nr:sulfurtransferase [Gammaproteobacteria bacterium]
MPFETLISAPELDALRREPGALCIVDCRFDLANPEAGATLWRESHLPNAVYAHLDNDLSSPIVPGETGRHPLPDPDALIAWLRSQGVSDDTQIVAYDDCNGGMAARLWWLSRWMGHAACAVLDGGMQAWEARYPLTDRKPTPKPGGNLSRQSSLLACLSTADVVESEDLILVDARTLARFRGDEEPIDPVAGHIPGAICLPLIDNTGENGHFRSQTQLRQRYTDALAPYADKTPVMYCGSGVTAAHNVLAMCHAGMPAPALYADSWSGWITDPHRPLA